MGREVMDMGRGITGMEGGHSEVRYGLKCF